MPAQVFGAEAAVAILNRAFSNTSLSNSLFNNQVTNAKATLPAGADASNPVSYIGFAHTFGMAFASQTPAQLAELILGNLGVLPDDALVAEGTAYITQVGKENIGIIALQLGAVLSTLEGNATYGAKASAWNAEVTAAYTYSSNSANTTSSTGEAPVTPPNQGQTYTLTSGIDNLVGTAGDDTFLGDDSGASPSLSPADTINGGSAGSDSAKLFISAAGRSLNASSVEKFFITSTNDASTFSMNGVAGVEQIWASNLTGDLSVTNTKNAATVGVEGGATNALGAGTENYEVEFVAGIASGTATATVAMAAGNVANFGVGTADGTQDFGTVKFVTSGSASSSIGDLKDGGGNDSNTTTVVIEGTQRMTINAEIENVTTVTATAADGGARVILDETLNVKFSGGKGADRVDITTGLTNADNLDGAEGSDTLRISDGSTVTLANVANVKNFEVLEIRAGSAGGAGAGTYDVSVLEAQNKLTSIVVSRVAAATDDVVVNNIQDGAKGSLVLALDEIDDVTYEVDSFVSGGTSDSATIVLNNAVALAANGVDSTGPLTFTNVDILTVNSVRNTLAASTENSIAGLTATDLDKLVVTGNEATNIAAAATSASLTEIDATGLTRDVTDAALTVNVSAAAIAAILIKGSTGVDTITANNAATNAVTVFTGGGSDVLQLGFTGAAHTLKFTATALNSGDVAAGSVIAINAGNAFQAADTVTIDFGSTLEGLLKVGGANLGTTLANVALVGQAFGPNTNVIAIDNGNDTVFQIDLNGDGVYTQASDFQITLTGLANNTLNYIAATDVFTFTATA